MDGMDMGQNSWTRVALELVLYRLLNEGAMLWKKFKTSQAGITGVFVR